MIFTCDCSTCGFKCDKLFTTVINTCILKNIYHFWSVVVEGFKKYIVSNMESHISQIWFFLTRDMKLNYLYFWMNFWKEYFHLKKPNFLRWTESNWSKAVWITICELKTALLKIMCNSLFLSFHIWACITFRVSVCRCVCMYS